MAPKFGELRCCSCLPLLPSFACSILATWGQPFSRALYLYLPGWSQGQWDDSLLLRGWDLVCLVDVPLAVVHRALRLLEGQALVPKEWKLYSTYQVSLQAKLSMGNWGIMRSICRLLLGYQMVEAPLVLPGPRLGLVVLALVLPPPVALLHRLVPAHLLRVALLDRDLKKKDLD